MWLTDHSREEAAAMVGDKGKKPKGRRGGKGRSIGGSNGDAGAAGAAGGGGGASFPVVSDSRFSSMHSAPVSGRPSGGQCGDATSAARRGHIS